MFLNFKIIILNSQLKQKFKRTLCNQTQFLRFLIFTKIQIRLRYVKVNSINVHIRPEIV